jgi:hypothetical protein
MGACLGAVFVGAVFVGAPLAGQAKVGIKELRKQLYSQDYRVYEAGLKGFQRLGISATPSLMAILREHSEKAEMPLPARLAARCLERLEHRATAVIPDLMREIPRGSDAYFRLVARVLGRIGPYAPKLRLAIKREILGQGEDHLYYEDVAIAVSRLELDPTADEDELGKALNGPDCAKKVMVCELLAKKGTEGSWAAGDLRQLFRQGRHGARVTVWLDKVGVEKHVWSNTLDDEQVNCELAYALVRVSRNREVPIAAFLQVLAHPRPEYRREAAVALGVRGSTAELAVLDLVRSSYESRDQVAWEAITALGQIGPRADAAIPHLEYLARGRNRGRAIRARAALALVRGK